MPTLSSSIVKHQIATMRDVEEALARQVIYGGDLATNLLELAAVSEPALTRVLAESHGLEPAPTGELPAAPDSTRRLVPGELAMRHGFYPLEEREGALVVAVSEPLAGEVEEDLAFSLGVRVVQRAAPLVRVHQALARDYRLPLDRRSLRIVAKLEGRPDPSPSSMPGPLRAHVDAPALPRPPSHPPVGLPATELPSFAEPPAPTRRSMPPPEAREVVARQFHAPVARAPAAEGSSDVPPPASRRSLSPTPRALRSLARPQSQPPKSRPRRLGPYTAAMADWDLLKAENRDDVLRAFFDFSSQYFEYAALFAVHGELAEGRDAHGPGADRVRVNGIGVPLDLPSSLAVARRESTWQLVRLGSDGLDRTLVEDLARPANRVAFLLPIVVRERCVLILYGDHGSADVELAAVGDVIAFAPLVATALENVIMRRKLGAAPTGTPLPHLTRDRPRAPRPSLEERAAALAGALELPATGDLPELRSERLAVPAAPAVDARAVSTRRATPPPIRRRAQTLPSASSTPSLTAGVAINPLPAPEKPVPIRAAPIASIGPQPATSTPATLVTSPTPPHQPRPAVSAATLAALARPVIVIGERRKSTPTHGTPRAAAITTAEEPAPIPLTRRSSPSPASEALDDGWDAPSPGPLPSAKRAGTSPGMGSGAQRKKTLIGLPDPEGSRPPPRRDSAPRLALVADADDGPEIAIGAGSLDPELEDEILRSGEAPLAPSSRSIMTAAHRPRPRQSSDEMRLPSVIVDVASDCRDLVKRLISGDVDAADKLVQIGEPAATELVAAFPGPITAELRRGVGEGPPRASDCGPVLRVLARIGYAAAPFVIVRTADTDPRVRAWATRLIGEMPTLDGARAVARRLVDSDADVRRSALAAGRMLQADPELRGAVRDELADTAGTAPLGGEIRQAALEALADLRDPRSVPRLVRLLSDRDPAIAKSAHWALVTLSRQDFARDAVRWTEWWEQHAAHHRIEWLIDGLMHDDADIRRAAGDELKSLTKEYFGYYDDLPRKERARAHQRYRDWWEAKGKARFH